MSRRTIVGVMGAGESASSADLALAEELGERVAARGWVLLTGGRDAGVMAAAVRGAKRVEGSLTLGILPGEGGSHAPGLDIAVFTGIGQARNAINVLTSDVVIVCGSGGAGTASEAAMALKLGRPLVLLRPAAEALAFYRGLAQPFFVAASPDEAVARIERDCLGAH